MLKSISTTEFITSLIVVTCVYYTVVLIRYYRKEIRAFWSRQFKKQINSASAAEPGAVIVTGKADEAKDVPGAD